MFMLFKIKTKITDFYSLIHYLYFKIILNQMKITGTVKCLYLVFFQNFKNNL